jgi:hypothetical protein
MAYLTATGELVRLATEDGSIGGATAAVGRNSVFGLRGNDVVEMALTAEVSKDPGAHPSRVIAVERRLCTLADMTPITSLNESCDGKFLSVAVKCVGDDAHQAIAIINVRTGKVKELCRFDNTPLAVSHVQWSRTNPRLLSFAGVPDRIWIVDIRNGKPWCPYHQWPGELVTHESWWVDGQILFCGGLHPKPTEDAHLKILDPKTGVVRIIGPGSWWPEGTPSEISRRNWWHAAGSADGRWVAADNWHGDIMLFEGRTTRDRLLTTNHRTYGKGVHPHVGWDRKGRQVVFTSHKLGNPDVCVATIPDKWQKDVQESQ